MNRGRKTCKILKEIRQQIADKNDIEYITSECHFQGECKGTCPKCESEVKYLENELYKRKQLGKAATIAGISLGIAGTFSACNAPQQPNTPIAEQEIATEMMNVDTISADTIPVPYPPPVGYIEIDTVEKEEFIIEVLDGLVIDDDFEDLTKDNVFVIVEQNPEYSEGEEECQKFIENNLVYPKEAKEKEIQGMVYVGFVVEKDGTLSDIKVLRGIGGGCDEEAMRVVKMMPKWKPGKQRGKEVRVPYNMPVRFSLDK